MRRTILITCIIGTLLFCACRPDPPALIPLPTKICIRTQHHFQPIPNATVYLKYNTDVFPGYDKPASYYDAHFSTGPDDHGCIESVPEGKHWLVSFGYDSLYYPHDVKGSVSVNISLNGHATIDTLLYISE
jgi:hypothetical protein